jgi:hypothetical protein
VTEQEKDKGDLQYLLHGASDLTKRKVKLTEYQLMERMMVFLKSSIDMYNNDVGQKSAINL